MRTRFAIVGMQRSGTTVTHLCLSGHPQVSMPVAEVFADPFFSRGVATFTGGWETYEERRDGFLALFDALSSLHVRPESTAFGLKTALIDAEGALAFASCLRDHLPQLKVVLVVREDLVAQYGSFLRARSTGRWHSYGGDGSARTDAAAGRVEIPLPELDAYVATCRRALAQLRSLAESHELIELGYERDIQASRWERLFDFLELPQLAPDWIRMRKVAPAPEAFIADYPALRARLDSLPGVSEQDTRREAAAHREQRRAAENPMFLLHRGRERNVEGQPLEAHADALAALLGRRGAAIESNVDLGMAFEVLRAAWSALDDDALVERSMQELEEAYAGDRFFRLQRGWQRLRQDRPAEARVCILDALGAGDFEAWVVEWAESMLADADRLLGELSG